MITTADHIQKRRINLPPVLLGFCVVSVTLTAVALLAILVSVYGLHLHSFPYAYYSLPLRDSFIDLLCFQNQFAHFHSTSFFGTRDLIPYNYPAACAPLYEFFFASGHPIAIFLITCAALLSALCILLCRMLIRRDIGVSTAIVFTLTALLLSYPLAMEISRANMEIFIWLITGAGIVAYLRERMWLATLLLCLAGAMKLIPFIFLILLFKRRKYLEIVVGLLAAGLFTVFSMWLICPDIHGTYVWIHRGLSSYQSTVVARYFPVAIGVDHSLFGLIKRTLPIASQTQYENLLRFYTPGVAILAVGAYVLRMRKLPVINQILCITVASLLLPPASFDYRLLHLYTPWALLVIFAVDKYRNGNARVPGLWPVFLCLAVLLSQTGEVILHGERLGGQIKAVTLVVLAILALRYPFPSVFDHSSPDRVGVSPGLDAATVG